MLENLLNPNIVEKLKQLYPDYEDHKITKMETESITVMVLHGANVSTCKVKRDTE